MSCSRRALSLLLLLGLVFVVTLVSANSRQEPIAPKPQDDKPVKAAEALRPQDIEDCVACHFVWGSVERAIGNSMVLDNVYDAMSRFCHVAKKAPIFYPGCEFMGNHANSMADWYINGMDVSSMCIKAQLCPGPVEDDPEEDEEIPPPEPKDDCNQFWKKPGACGDHENKPAVGEMECNPDDNTGTCQTICCVPKKAETCQSWSTTGACPRPTLFDEAKSDTVCADCPKECCKQPFTCKAYFAKGMCKKVEKTQVKGVEAKVCNEQTDCASECCEGGGENIKKEFSVKVHFANGYSSYQLFDYFAASAKSTSYNAGAYTKEQNKFADAWKTLETELKAKNADPMNKKPFVLDISGYASSAGNAAKNKLLSENRVKSMACYVSKWLLNHNVKDFTLNLGHFGEEKAGGMDPKQQAKDRAAVVFMPTNQLFMTKFKAGAGKIQAVKGVVKPNEHCADTTKWQDANVKNEFASYLTYGGKNDPSKPWQQA